MTRALCLHSWNFMSQNYYPIRWIEALSQSVNFVKIMKTRQRSTDTCAYWRWLQVLRDDSRAPWRSVAAVISPRMVMEWPWNEEETCPPDTFIHRPMHAEGPSKTVTLVTSELVKRNGTGKRLRLSKVCMKAMSKSHRLCFSPQITNDSTVCEFSIISEICQVAIVP